MANIIKKKLSELKENPDNPRDISAVALEGLKRSIEKFDMVEVIVWNEQSGKVIGGNQRLKALKLLKTPEFEVDVSVVNLPREEEEVLMVQLNNPETQGRYNPDKALAIINRLEVSNPELFDKLGFEALKKAFKITIDDKRRDAPPELELRPYEHYDYVLCLFENQFDFMRACELLGIEKRSVTAGNNVKVGLGRGINGKKLIELLEKNETKTEKGKV